jgi:hypothetical protein
LKKIDKADWYEVVGNEGIILVSNDVVGGVDPEDADIKLTKDSEIMRIDLPLHRWNEKDGFYHA